MEFLNVIILLIDNLFIYISLKFGDWGLGIGPNPQSPIPNPHLNDNKMI